MKLLKWVIFPSIKDVVNEAKNKNKPVKVAVEADVYDIHHHRGHYHKGKYYKDQYHVGVNFSFQFNIDNIKVVEKVAHSYGGVIGASDELRDEITRLSNTALGDIKELEGIVLDINAISITNIPVISAPWYPSVVAVI